MCIEIKARRTCCVRIPTGRNAWDAPLANFVKKCQKIGAEFESCEIRTWNVERMQMYIAGRSEILFFTFKNINDKAFASR